MANFEKLIPPTVTKLNGFKITADVIDYVTGTAVNLSYTVTLASDNFAIANLTGDLKEFLTAQQISNFENAANNLYAKAKTELLG